MPWSNPDYEHEMPAFDPEPVDDDPWDVPSTSTGDDLSDEDSPDDPQLPLPPQERK